MKYLDSVDECADAIAKAERWHHRVQVFVVAVVLAVALFWDIKL
jgi:hypothetical protein